MERDGQAYWSMWEGLLYPLTGDCVNTPPFSWSFCPWCGGEVRLGIRQQLKTPPDWRAGEGEE
jgi:hypothetical protein